MVSQTFRYLSGSVGGAAENDESSSKAGVLELDPGWDQVVFAGDSLTLRCFVTWPKSRGSMPQQQQSVNNQGVNGKPRILWYRDDVLINSNNTVNREGVGTTSGSPETLSPGVSAPSPEQDKVMTTTVKPEVVQSSTLKGKQHRLSDKERINETGKKNSVEGILVNTKHREDGVER